MKQAGKIIIIGAGHVGSHAAYALASQGLAGEIVLIDIDREKAAAQALDIGDAAAYLPYPVKIKAGDYTDAGDGDVMVIAVGTNPDKAKGETRMDTLAATAAIIRDVAEEIRQSGFHGILVSISNPADVIAHYLQYLLSWPAGKIISTGTALDSARLSRVTAEDILKLFGKPDVIWASPDCATFSIAAISHHRKKNPETGSLEPVSAYAKFCDRVDKHVLELIEQLQPKYYFIENPRGGMRKMEWMKNLPRYTVTYCQYGDNRMKPTDIWTNHPNPEFLPMCHNGDSCHVPAPRGSKTGTQGLKGSRERSVIPQKLCEHIVDICEEG